MAVVFIISASVGMITPIFIVFLQDKFTTNIGTLVWAIIPAAIVGAYLRSYLGQLSDRFGRTRLMALGLIGSGIFSFLLPGLPGIVWLAIFWTLESVGWAMAGPAEEAMVADLTGHQVRGMGYGLYTFVSSMGASVGPLLGGWLYDTVGQTIPSYPLLNFSTFTIGKLTEKHNKAIYYIPDAKTPYRNQHKQTGFNFPCVKMVSPEDAKAQAN